MIIVKMAIVRTIAALMLILTTMVIIAVVSLPPHPSVTIIIKTIIAISGDSNWHPGYAGSCEPCVKQCSQQIVLCGHSVDILWRPCGHLVELEKLIKRRKYFECSHCVAPRARSLRPIQGFADAAHWGYSNCWVLTLGKKHLAHHQVAEAGGVAWVAKRRNVLNAWSLIPRSSYFKPWISGMSLHQSLVFGLPGTTPPFH